GLLATVRLQGDDPDGDVGRQLAELALNQRGRHVLGGLRERAESIRERALEDDRAEAPEAAGGPPERLRRARVAGVDHAARAVVDDEARGGHGVTHGDRRDPEIAAALP